MNTILTQTTSNIAIIRTIVNPEAVSDINDMFDARIIVGSIYREPEVMHFQFDLLIPPASPDVAKQVATKLYRELEGHLTSPEFVTRYGEACMIGGNDISKNERRKIEQRLITSFERMVRFGTQSSYIRSHHSRTGACTMEVRLPRGVSVRAIHTSLKVEIERENRPLSGHMTLCGEQYGYTLWFPGTVDMGSLSFDVLKKAVEKEIATSFPFINLSDFDMTQVRDLIRNN